MSAETDRPAGLRWVTLMMCLLNVSAFLYPRPVNIGFGFFLAVVIIGVGVSFVALWYFWRGRNWARWLVLAMCGLAIVNLTHLGSLGSFASVMMVVNAVLGVWLLYWLNTQEVRAYFSRRAETGAA